MVLRSTPVAVKIFLLFWALGGNEISSLLGHSNLVVPHPQRITGKLPNGISYTFLPNDKPENRLSLRLIVATGAFMEKDREDGLAHFIEHMAFNGSVHFPSGSLIKYFQRIGMGFGNDTNAATSLTHTVYKLELPGCSEEEIRQGFTVLTDYAHGVLFPAEEIDRERGVILSELRTRDTPQHRIGKEQMKFLFPHHLLSKRFVIGTTDTLNGFRREDFLSFYKRWYTSDRMHLVAVGPVNPDKLLQQMKESFGALPSSKSRKDPPMGKITRPKGRPVGIWNEPELTHATIEWVTHKTVKNLRDNEDRRFKEILMHTVEIMLKNRWDNLLKLPNSPLLGANFIFENLFSTLDLSAFTFDCPTSRWTETLGLLEKEVRSIFRFGFRSEEVDLAKKELRYQLEDDVKTVATDLSSLLADEVVETIENKKIYTSSQQDLDFFDKIQSRITARRCGEALQVLWRGPSYLCLSGPIGDKVTADDILRVCKESSKTPAIPPAPPEEKGFAYQNFGPKGTVKTAQPKDDIDVQRIVFENNVRLTLKKTSFAAHQIAVQVRVGSGFLEIASDSKPGLDRLASVAFVRGGLVAHDLAEIKRLFSGKKVGINASVSDDALIFSGTTQASDLRDQLSLLCAYLSYPSFRPEALEEFRRSLDPLYNLFRCTASGVLTQSVPRYLTHNDERFGYPEKEVLAQRNFEELSQVLKPILSQGYIEICLVGDLDPATSIEAVAETFGALPTRSPSKERFETCRELRWPSPGDTAKLFSFESEIPKATLQVYWPTEDIWNLSNNRRLNILSELFKNRLIFEIRQALGESYTPQVDSLSSDTFTDRGAIVATLIVDPQKAPALLDKIVDIGHTLATNEIGEDEFRRALNPILTKIKDYLQTNEYWMANLCNVHEYPIKLRWPTTLLSEYTSIQREEVQALAKKYLPRERAIKITLRPKNAPLPSPNSTDKE